jgi:hypothetical protein
MSKIQEKLKETHDWIESKKPRTLGELIDWINLGGFLSDYGYSVKVVRYMGHIQGARIEVTGRTKTHYLPSKDEVYAVSVERRFIEAGW